MSTDRFLVQASHFEFQLDLFSHILRPAISGVIAPVIRKSRRERSSPTKDNSVDGDAPPNRNPQNRLVVLRQNRKPVGLSCAQVPMCVAGQVAHVVHVKTSSEPISDLASAAFARADVPAQAVKSMRCSNQQPCSVRFQSHNATHDSHESRIHVS